MSWFRKAISEPETIPETIPETEPEKAPGPPVKRMRSIIFSQYFFAEYVDADKQPWNIYQTSMAIVPGIDSWVFGVDTEEDAKALMAEFDKHVGAVAAGKKGKKNG